MMRLAVPRRTFPGEEEYNALSVRMLIRLGSIACLKIQFPRSICALKRAEREKERGKGAREALLAKVPNRRFAIGNPRSDVSASYGGLHIDFSVVPHTAVHATRIERRNTERRPGTKFLFGKYSLFQTRTRTLSSIILTNNLRWICASTDRTLILFSLAVRRC